MKRLFVLVLFGLFLFGCTSGPSQPQATPYVVTPTPMPTAPPTPTPEPVAAAAIEAAAESIPLGGGISSLTGVESKAPEQYTITSESEFKADVALTALNRLEFDDGNFMKTLRKIATASLTQKTMSWQPSEDGVNQFTILWQTQQNNAGNLVFTGAAVEVVLSKTGTSQICTHEDGEERQCVTPSKEQVDALWAALNSNAFEETLQLVAPGVDLKTLLKVEKSTKTTYIGRACDGYTLTLTQTALDMLSAFSDVNSRTITDMKGDLCIDAEYGFPLYMNLLTSIGPVSEHVTRFSTAKVGALQYPYSFVGLCRSLGINTCDNKKYTNPVIGWAPYPEETWEKITTETAQTCQAAGRVTLNVGGCVRYGYGHGFVLKTASGGQLSLVKFDQNLVAFGEFQIKPTGDIKKDQYDLGGDFYEKALALAVYSISEGSADLDFISFDPDWDKPPGTEYQRKYSRGFKDTAKPTAEEAYYAIFSPGSCVGEGLQKFGNSDCADLKNGAKAAFYWYYPEPYSEFSLAGRLDTRVTAYVWEKDMAVNKGQSVALDLDKPVTLTVQGSRIRLNLVKADLTRDGSIQVDATSSS